MKLTQQRKAFGSALKAHSPSGQDRFKIKAGVYLKKARFVLEYSLLIGVVVGVLLTMQNYIKRAMQGQIKTTSEQIAEQYDYGFTQSDEGFVSNSHSFELTTLGWDHPTTYTHTNGAYQSNSERILRPLKARPPR